MVSVRPREAVGPITSQLLSRSPPDERAEAEGLWLRFPSGLCNLLLTTTSTVGMFRYPHELGPDSEQVIGVVIGCALVSILLVDKPTVGMFRPGAMSR